MLVGITFKVRICSVRGEWIDMEIFTIPVSDVRREASTVTPRIYHGTVKENSPDGTEVDLNIPLMVSTWDKLTGGENVSMPSVDVSTVHCFAN